MPFKYDVFCNRDKEKNTVTYNVRYSRTSSPYVAARGYPQVKSPE